MKRFIALILMLWKYSILSSILFNFRHLPLRQAWRLPIESRKPHLYGVGLYRLKLLIFLGMIRLAGFGCHMYSDNGIYITQ